MGLDQYLYAKRVFETDSEKARDILAVYGRTLEELTADTGGEDGANYLGFWREADDDFHVGRAVMVTAGLWDFRHEGSPHGLIGIENGKLAVTIVAIYWRKANQIHKWFVDKCQDGVDECQESEPINWEQLSHLRSLCQDALKAYEDGDHAKAAEILPPEDGFFFGSTDINEWYARDLTGTITDIEKVLNLAAASPVTFTYHSSW